MCEHYNPKVKFEESESDCCKNSDKNSHFINGGEFLD